MIAYVDSSVLLRAILGEDGLLPEWRTLTRPISSELIRLECLRTIDRARIRLRLRDEEVARYRRTALEGLGAFRLLAMDQPILARAAEPFPTLLRALDAIHLSTAILVREQLGELAFATHDAELATAARAAGFDVLG